MTDHEVPFRFIPGRNPRGGVHQRYFRVDGDHVHSRDGGAKALEASALLTERHVTLEQLPAGSSSSWLLTQLPECSLAFVSAAPSRVTWHRANVAPLSGMLVLVRHGEVSLHGDDVLFRTSEVAVIGPGSRGGEGVAFSVQSPRTEFLAIRFPHRLVADIQFAGSPSGAAAAAFGQQLLPMFEFFLGIARLPPADLDEVRLNQVVVNAVRATLMLLSSPAPERVPVFARAWDVIRSDFRDPALSTESIAQYLEVSPRALRAAFRGHGTSVLREIRRVRVSALREARGTDPHADIVRLGKALGFKSRASIYRALAEDAA